MLTAFDGNSITYDAIGNPASYYNGTRWTFGWANGRNLATASKSGTSLSFAYDASGLRTGKTVDGTTYRYYYASGKLMRMTWGSNTIDFFYDANGTPYAMKYNGTLYYYVTNLQGDVMRIVNASGTVAASYDYDPYGKVISATGSLANVNPLRYRGYVYDTETGFYYLQGRYYDPEICRFINADNLASTGQGFVGCNMFAYCNNNPVNMVDQSGTMPKFSPEELVQFTEWVETPLGTLLYATKVNGKGYLYEYWLDSNREPRWSRHHTNHGNETKHPVVPHDHEWHDDDNGNNTEDRRWQPPNSGFRPPDSDNNSNKVIAATVGTVALGYGLYLGVKWAIAVFAAPVTGGGSLMIAGVTP